MPGYGREITHAQYYKSRGIASAGLVTEGKLLMPNLKEIIESNIIREEEVNMVHSSFYYPKEGGSQFIVDRWKTGL